MSNRIQVFAIFSLALLLASCQKDYAISAKKPCGNVFIFDASESNEGIIANINLITLDFGADESTTLSLREIQGKRQITGNSFVISMEDIMKSEKFAQDKINEIRNSEDVTIYLSTGAYSARGVVTNPWGLNC